MNDLVPIRFLYKDSNYRQYWLYKCFCSKEFEVRLSNIKSGHTRSCGCIPKKTVKHGQCGTRTYRIWSNMVQRCTNPNNNNYYKYGDRGITVCKRWLVFKNFLEDMGEAPINESLDRIDNDDNYTKDNCQWSTAMEQALNTRTNRLITYNGRTQPMIMWAREFNIDYQTLRARLDNGWTTERALTIEEIVRGGR